MREGYNFGADAPGAGAGAVTAKVTPVTKVAPKQNRSQLVGTASGPGSIEELSKRLTI